MVDTVNSVHGSSSREYLRTTKTRSSMTRPTEIRHTAVGRRAFPILGFHTFSVSPSPPTPPPPAFVYTRTCVKWAVLTRSESCSHVLVNVVRRLYSQRRRYANLRVPPFRCETIDDQQVGGGSLLSLDFLRVRRAGTSCRFGDSRLHLGEDSALATVIIRCLRSLAPSIVVTVRRWLKVSLRRSKPRSSIFICQRLLLDRV